MKNEYKNKEGAAKIMEVRKPEFSGSTLKMIALVTMGIDHFGAVVVQRLMGTPGYDYNFWSSLYWPLRYIGRLAFPIFCFFLVEGFLHTSNVKKYMGRLLVFAVVSEIPFNLGIAGNWISVEYQNVFWELAVGIMALLCLREIEKRSWNYVSQIFGRLAVLGIFALGAEFLNLDYGMYGIISIVALYVFRQNKMSQLVIGAVSFIWEKVAPLAFLLLALYNGKRGRNIKYIFYVFYPVHLLLFYLVARMLGCQY